MTGIQSIRQEVTKLSVQNSRRMILNIILAIGIAILVPLVVILVTQVVELSSNGDRTNCRAKYVDAYNAAAAQADIDVFASNDEIREITGLDAPTVKKLKHDAATLLETSNNIQPKFLEETCGKAK
jgi:hypothetical protein